MSHLRVGKMVGAVTLAAAAVILAVIGLSGTARAADNDVSIVVSSDPAPNVPANLTTLISINISLTNGASASDVAVSASLIGPSSCLPRLVPDNDGLDSDGSAKSPDILTGPTILNGQHATRLDWTAFGFAPAFRSASAAWMPSRSLAGSSTAAALPPL